MRSFSAAIVVAIIGAAGGPAAAQVSDGALFAPAVTSAGSVYGSAGFQAARYFMPGIGGYQSQFSRNTSGIFSTAVRPDGNFRFNPSADVTLPAGTITAGYVLPPDSLPFAGENARIQVTGFYGGGSQNHSDVNPTGTPFSVQIGLDAVNNNLSVLRPATSDFNNDTTLAGGQLAVVSDFASDGWILTPSLRFFGSALRQSFSVTTSEGTGSSIFTDTYSERIRTDRYAIGAGLGVTRILSPTWSITLGISASGVYTRAQYDGGYCFDFFASAGGCDGLLGTGSVSARADRWGAQLGGLAGLSLRLAPQAVLSLSANVDWYSAAPGTTHPTTTLAGGGSPASIRWDGMTAVGGMLRLAFGI